MPEINDAQSRLNATHVKSILSPRSEEEVRKAILTGLRRAIRSPWPVAGIRWGGSSSGPEPCISIFVGWIESLDLIVGMA